jgi:hypothetical protein
LEIILRRKVFNRNNEVFYFYLSDTRIWPLNYVTKVGFGLRSSQCGLLKEAPPTAGFYGDQNYKNGFLVV